MFGPNSRLAALNNPDSPGYGVALDRLGDVCSDCAESYRIDGTLCAEHTDVREPREGWKMDIKLIKKPDDTYEFYINEILVEAVTSVTYIEETNDV
jgi:hypothetical protein